MNPPQHLSDPLTPDEIRASNAMLDRLRPGARVVVADGVGAPLGLMRALERAARAVGGVELILGWYLGPRLSIPTDAFPVVRSYMGGYGLARNERVRLAPVRLSAMPALMAGVWRPDLLLLGLTESGGSLTFGTEVAWLPAATRYARHTVVELNHGLPNAAASDTDLSGAAVVLETTRAPLELARPPRSTETDRIGAHVAALVAEGSALQVGPGVVGDAVIRAIEVPVSLRSGIVGDAALDLQERGLLRGEPVGAYVAGGPRLYDWSRGRALAHAVEKTHDTTALSSLPLVAVNTALEVDPVGQINVESVNGRAIAGMGGLPDFAVGAARSERGLSIVALPRVRGGNPTLVPQLSGPVSCTRSDIDILVTELGSRDLRGLNDEERRRTIAELW